ncbi:MAG TPA: hypothetical protein VJN71_07055 [Nitrososphaerales archaeon]|nr:hypothetical protein [Nitrososphaerales archaeon]
MRINLSLFVFAAILGVLLFSAIGFNFVRVAQASTNPWTGNDDGEFGFPNCDSCTVSSGTIVQGVGISGNLNPSGVGASLQWNQDYVTDLSHQFEGGFVQAVISDDPVIQYGEITMDMEVIFPNGQAQNFTYSQRPIIPLMFEKGASWNTFEFTNSKGQIYAIQYQLIQPQGTVYDYTLGVPATFTWLRTQLCWCGYSVDYPAANFASSSAGETTESVSGSITSSWGHIGPPSILGTAETSNMEYSCLYNDGSTRCRSGILTKRCLLNLKTFTVGNL